MFFFIAAALLDTSSVELTAKKTDEVTSSIRTILVAVKPELGNSSALFLAQKPNFK